MNHVQPDGGPKAPPALFGRLRRHRPAAVPYPPRHYAPKDQPRPQRGLDGLTQRQRAHLQLSSDIELDVDEQAWHAAEYQRLLEQDAAGG